MSYSYDTVTLLDKTDYSAIFTTVPNSVHIDFGIGRFIISPLSFSTNTSVCRKSFFNKIIRDCVIRYLFDSSTGGCIEINVKKAIVFTFKNSTRTKEKVYPPRAIAK